MKHLAAIAALALLAACATGAISDTAPPPPGSTTIPPTPLELGDWRNATAPATLAVFEANVARRYGAGLPLSDAIADLRRQEFTCTVPTRAEDGRGAPPAQACRRTMTASGCTHTWQVHLFANGGVLARSRGLYDRRCGNDGLLGGPG